MTTLQPAPAVQTPANPRLTQLIRISGGPRYAVALGVDALGAGMLRPFLLLYAINVLGLGVARAGLAMSVGMLLGLAAVPLVGRWIDRGARSLPVAATMLVRVVGVAVLVLTPGSGGGVLWAFTAAALLLGIGNQCWPPAHAALVSTLAEGRHRDAALAAGRSLRNAGLGAGALVATLTTAAGTTGALRTLAWATAAGFAAAGVLVWSMRVTAAAPQGVSTPATGPGLRGITALDLANVPYAFCFNVLEVALPAVLVTQLHASGAWSSGIFVGNTVLVVTTQLAVVLWTARFARHLTLAASGLVLTVSYLGFWAGGGIGGWGGPTALAAVSVLYTAGEILYTGSATALIAATTPAHQLGRALARFQLTSGIALAASPAVLTALLARGPAALWATLAAATLLAAFAMARWAPREAAQR